MNTYANVILKGPQQAAIAAHLSAHKHCAFVGPTVDGVTFVYTPFDTWTAVAEELSRTFQCPTVFSFGYDSDVFGYTIYDDGYVREEYVSAPYYDATGCGPARRAGPRGGQADVLCAVVGAEHAVAQVATILHPPVEGPLVDAAIDAFDQHWALAEALALPPEACVTSYESLRVDGYARDRASDGGPLIETP